MSGVLFTPFDPDSDPNLSWNFYLNNDLAVPIFQIRSLSVEELRSRLASLDPQMDQEIEEIHQRYEAKRQPILDAIEAKKRRQQNF